MEKSRNKIHKRNLPGETGPFLAQQQEDASSLATCCAQKRSDYKAKGLVSEDPFVSLDVEGVGELILMAVERGRRARAGMKMGLCGESLGTSWNVEVP